MKKPFVSLLLGFLFFSLSGSSADATQFHRADADKTPINGGKVLDLVGPLGPSLITARDVAVDRSKIKGLSGATGATGLPLTPGVLGPQGPIGVTGPQGPRGPIGTTGLQGATGIQGIAGLQGAAGLKGASGSAGISGTIGPLGPRGLQGAPGLQGSPGAIGPMGPTGSQGASGSQGGPGAKGDAGLQGDTGPRGPIGEPGPRGELGAHGSFLSNQIQNADPGKGKAVTFNITDEASTRGVSVRNDSQITFEKAGTYNIQFSAQILTSERSESDSNTAIWLSKKGEPVPLTTGWIYYNKYYRKSVEAWNFFVTVEDNDYYELMWWDSQEKTQLLAEAGLIVGELKIPDVPSVILTVHQVG